MRRTLLAIAALWIGGIPADASGQEMRREAGATTDSIMDIYDSRLNLTDEQDAAIRDLLETQGARAREMFEKTQAGGREEMRKMRPEFEELRQQTDAGIEDLLNEEQISEYREIRREMDAQRQERRRLRTRPPQP